MTLQLCKVTRSLFISNARSACSDELLQQEAVTLCINVSKQQPFPSSSGVARMRIPVYDDPNEDLQRHFDRSADAVQTEADRGGRSLVYCKNGRSRSAAVCAAYLMKHRGLTLTQALQVTRVLGLGLRLKLNHQNQQRLKTARHVVDPNPGFMSQLQRYEEELRKRRGAS